MLYKLGRCRVQIKKFGGGSEADEGCAGRVGEWESKGVRLGVTTGLGGGEGRIEDWERKNGTGGSRRVKGKRIRAEGVGGRMVGRWYKGRKAAHSVIGKAEFGANVITEGDGEGLGGGW